MTQPKPTDKKPVKKASGRKTDTVPNLDEQPLPFQEAKDRPNRSALSTC